MKQLSLTKEMATSIAKKLNDAGYSKYEKSHLDRYTTKMPDSTFIHHSLNIIRARKNTKGEAIIKAAFGEPNGKASEMHDDNYTSWFFNGYTGKAGSSVI